MWRSYHCGLASNRAALLILIGATLVAACDSVAPNARTTFTSATDAEVRARIRAECSACDWEKAGSEAVVLAITLDDRAPIHLPVTRSGTAEYELLLGTIAPGRHTVSIAPDQNLSATSLRGADAATFSVEIDQIPATSPTHQALSLAPFVYARPDTVGKFTDVPLLMWYEVEPTARGKRYRYSVIFSNEDGGTPADRLMATWGRTTDIEYVYSVEVDGNGSILGEDMQGPKHEILPFKGRREGRHPLLWVSTENNMVLDHGTTSVRYAPAPEFVDLKNLSREVVMDANAWTYEVMAKELAREGKIADAPPGQGTIPDLRRYVFLEGCGEAGNNAISVSVKVKGQWFSSDRGVAEYRIIRDGCFRVAIPLAATAKGDDVEAIRVQAFARSNKPSGSPSRFRRLNTLFTLDEHYAPSPPTRIRLLSVNEVLKPDGPPFEIAR